MMTEETESERAVRDAGPNPSPARVMFICDRVERSRDMASSRLANLTENEIEGALWTLSGCGPMMRHEALGGELVGVDKSAMEARVRLVITRQERAARIRLGEGVES